MKDKEIKLQEIQKHNPQLYQDVMDGRVKLQDGYNNVMMDLTKTSEYKGRGTKGKNKIGLSKELDRIMKMYKPSLSELLVELKRLFPFTFDNHIK
jgi:hypothetical protein